MKLIAVISHKGGAGKTTSAVQLAEEMARRGQRTLLVDADRQQGAGLLLGIDAPAGCVQQTMVANLSYLGSARLTDLEIADCFASVATRFDIGIVDTPSLDDALARAWLREAAATLMVLQVDPLTVKTLPSALNTLEVVRALKPSIQILGLLPTMFDQNEEAHGRLLAELLSRKPDAVFTPVVPQDPGLMHRANAADCPPLGEAARQAYQCAVDRILRALASAEPSVALPHNSQQRVRPPWAQTAAPPARSTAPAPAFSQTPAAVQAATAPPMQATALTAPAAHAPAPPPEYAPAPAAPPADGPPQASRPAPGWDDPADAALETLADTRVQAPADRKLQAMPNWFPETRVDERGVARRQESWIARSRFAIACTVACLALIAAVVLGTLKRGPASGGNPANSTMPAALASVRTRQDLPDEGEKRPAEKTKPRKPAAQKRADTSGEPSKSGKSRGR